MGLEEQVEEQAAQVAAVRKGQEVLASGGMSADELEARLRQREIGREADGHRGELGRCSFLHLAKTSALSPRTMIARLWFGQQP